MADPFKTSLVRRAIARQSLFAATWLLSRLPYRMVKRIGRFFIQAGYAVTMRQKKIARESVRLAFGNSKSPEELEVIVRQCFTNFGHGMIELIYFMEHPAMIRERVRFTGQEHLEGAFAQGRGAIAVSGHFGSFPLMLLRCVQEGYPTHAIIRPARDQIIEEYFLNLRTRLGLKTIYSHPQQACVNAAIKALRGNELVFIPLDQNFGRSGGIFVDFFGRKAATAIGPAVLAKRTGAPVVPMFIVREPDDTHRIIVEPPLVFEEMDDDKEEIRVNIAKITQVIERYIRQYPMEWGWMHRRWKTKPQEGEKEEKDEVRQSAE